jgi:hypothetical protein
VRGLLIGAFAIFVINAYVLIDQKLVNNEISGTKTVSEVSAPNGDVDAYLLVNYTQKKTIKSSLGLGEDPPPTFSYYWVWIYQNSKFQSKNEMNNSYSDPCFKAENISPPDSLKVNWKGPEILEIHYKKARILNYHRTLRIQNQQGKDIFIKIKLVQDKPRK